jgi:hypothetical protein
MSEKWIFGSIAAVVFLVIVLIGVNLGGLCSKSNSNTNAQVFCPMIL